jgi:hypothetical protein
MMFLFRIAKSSLFKLGGVKDHGYSYSNSRLKVFFHWPSPSAVAFHEQKGFGC